jgi:hypothetical protein
VEVRGYVGASPERFVPRRGIPGRMELGVEF